MDPAKSRNKLIKIFSNPILGFTGTAASVIGIPLSIYLFIISQEYRDLTYFIEPYFTSIVPLQKPTNIIVSHKGYQVKGAVGAQRIAIWNKGKRSIRRSDILKPISICANSSVKLLEVSIKHITREITRLRLDEHDTAQGCFTVQWEILELGDGATIEMLFSHQDPMGEIWKIDGVIEGQRQLSNSSAKLDIYDSGIRILFHGFFVFIILLVVELALLMRSNAELRSRIIEQAEDIEKGRDDELGSMKAAQLRKLALTSTVQKILIATLLLIAFSLLAYITIQLVRLGPTNRPPFQL